MVTVTMVTSELSLSLGPKIHQRWMGTQWHIVARAACGACRHNSVCADGRKWSVSGLFPWCMRAPFHQKCHFARSFSSGHPRVAMVVFLKLASSWLLFHAQYDLCSASVVRAISKTRCGPSFPSETSIG